MPSHLRNRTRKSVGYIYNPAIKPRTTATAPVISTNSPLPAGEVEVAYNESIAAAESEDVDFWRLDNDHQLPPGLSLASNGTLSGTPTQAGTFVFHVNAYGPGGLVSKEFTLVIAE